MFTEEIAGHITDTLAIDGISASTTLDLIKRRVGGTPTDRMLVGAVMVMREQADRIAELESRVSELADDNERLEDEVADLEGELAALRARGRATPDKSTPAA